MSSIMSLSTFHLTIICVIATLIFYGFRYIIKPYRLIRFYRNQGIQMTFIPLTGYYMKDIENIQKHNDYYYGWKQKARQEPRPKAFGGNFGYDTHLVLLDPIMIKEFAQKYDLYLKHPEILAPLKDLCGRSLVCAEGDEWKRKKKLISTAFHFEFLKEMIPEIGEITREQIENWKNEDLGNFSIMVGFQRITGEIIGRLIFGKKFNDYKINQIPLHTFFGYTIKNLGEMMYDPAFQVFGKSLGKLGLNKFHKKVMEDLQASRNAAYKIVKDMIEEAKNKYKEGNKNSRKTLIDIFYEQRLDNPQDYLTDWEVTDEFMNFTTGGMDTSAHMLTMAAYYLIKNPQYKAKLLDEINQYFKDGKEVNIDTLNKMDFMNAFLKEALRMGNPGAISFERIAIKDHNLCDLRIKKGTTVVVGAIANGYDDRYFEDADTFKPERWLDQNSLTNKSLMNYPFLFTPFHGGPRDCIGRQLAMIEGKIIFSMYVKKFDSVLVDKNYKLVMVQRLLYEPETEIICKLTPRS